LIVIGKFRENYNDDKYPSIFEAIRKEPPEDKARVLMYLKSGTVGAISPGYLHDYVSNIKAAIRNPVCYNDGVYAWRSDVVYYYEHYNIELPEAFIKHALQKIK